MKEYTRIVQIKNTENDSRRAGLVKKDRIYLINDFVKVYDLANHAIKSGISLSGLINMKVSSESLDYKDVHMGKSEWKLMPSFDHPGDLNSCMISGTGLTHKSSAESRHNMHEAKEKADLTDSMKMYLWGVEGGHPEDGKIGVQPEWFYKGNGSILKGHGSVLEIPDYAYDGGEEPELAGIYLIGPEGTPWRIGLTAANEFSDHVMEKKNYLYLAPSKIRTCAIGPELVINPDFKNIKGEVRIYRNNQIHWQKSIHSGEDNMSHSLQNLEYHHFKYKNHRLPGQVHIHFLGADAFSFSDGIKLEDGDIMEIQWENMGKPLINTVKRVTGPDRSWRINPCN